MINHYSCCIYIRPTLLKLDLVCKQISVSVIIFDRNGGDFREKNYVSAETIIHLHVCHILVLFIVFEVLLFSCNWTES